MYIIHVGDILSYIIILFVHAAAIFGKYQISNNMVPPPPHFEKIRTINNESILRGLIMIPLTSIAVMKSDE